MKYGEIIQLGRHRLMYGDATRFEDVKSLLDGTRVDLVLTDPPYGINYIGPKPRKIGNASLTYAPVIGDINGDMFTDNYRILRVLCNRFIIWGGQNFTNILPPSCGWLVWNKCRNTDKLSFSDCELAWCNCSTRIKKYTHRWNGNNIEGSKDLNLRVHPTQKPVELHMKILEDFSKPGDVILDCFGGSGTTLIACEMTGRTCLMMEISPDYCDVIINRYNTLFTSNLFHNA